jgi:DNA-binding beta-propeller fold protein YncE
MQLRRSSFAVVAVAVVVTVGGLLGVVPKSATAVSRRSRAVLAVGNSYDGTITLIDAHTLKRLGSPLNVIPDGDTPRDPTQAAAYPSIIASRGEFNYSQDIAVSPDGAVLYVSRGYLGDVAAFSLRTRALLWRLEVPGLRADHLAVSPDGRRLFVSVLPGTRVWAINTRTHRFIGSYRAGDFPHVLEFSPDGRHLYSGSLGNQLAPYGQDRGIHQLTVTDPRTLHVVRIYRFKAGVRPFTFAPGGRLLVLQLSYFNGFKVLNLRTGRIVRTVNLPKRGPGRTLAPQNYPNSAAHHGIAISGDTICDAGTISNYAALVSLRTGRVHKIVPVGQAPAEAITGPGGKLCFLTNRGPTALHRARITNGTGDSVSAIDYKTGREVARINVGTHPQCEIIATIPDTVLRAGRFLSAAK